MGVFVGARCDGCGLVKEQSNNWWTVMVDDNGDCVLSPLPKDFKEDTLCEDEKILCGQKCVFNAISSYMSLKGGKHAVDPIPDQPA